MRGFDDACRFPGTGREFPGGESDNDREIDEEAFFAVGQALHARLDKPQAQEITRINLLLHGGLSAIVFFVQFSFKRVER